MSIAGELRPLRRSFQRHGRAAATRDDLRDLVEVPDAHEFLMLDRLVAVALECKLARLQIGIRRHAAFLVILGQGEHGVIERVEARQGDELEFVTHRAQLLLEARELGAMGYKFQFVTLSGFHALKDRKSTRLNSSHTVISYAVFCLKK